MKADLLTKLEQHVTDIAALNRQIKSAKQSQIKRPETKTAASTLARRWFDEIVFPLGSTNLDAAVLEGMSRRFGELLRISKRAAAKNTYLHLLAEILVSYKSDVIHGVEIAPEGSSSALSIAPYLNGLTADEGAYLEEAQRCLSVNGIRACIVMGWCATVSRMHEKVAAIGFPSFNKASEDMASKQFGRFKPFNKKFKVESVSELRRTVFDTDLLWILEFMELIDSNQHERLRHCFELRNNSAHPGQAPISGENLYSFYSDITKIVLKNQKFEVIPRPSDS
ncbi:MAG TPA: hypothetical protein VNH44_00300 [Micropepsaceae bacterium]|nr:hypothetical protein [Micropepsaceae bacterium]